MNEIGKKWLTEPSEDFFEYKGYDCYLFRNKMGTWCGYVALKKGDPFYGVDYDGIDIDVHGGLTYGEHVIITETKEECYMIGFDCNHINDFMPNVPADSAFSDLESDESDIRLIHHLNKMLEFKDERNIKIYRDIEFARSECRKIVHQILKEKITTTKE